MLIHGSEYEGDEPSIRTRSSYQFLIGSIDNDPPFWEFQIISGEGVSEQGEQR